MNLLDVGAAGLAVKQHLTHMSCILPRAHRPWLTVAVALACCLLLDAAGALQMVFSSSCTVYGAPDKVPITEDTPLKAISPYGRTKLFQVRPGRCAVLRCTLAGACRAGPPSCRR